MPRLITATALAALSAQSALAELTVDQAWEIWQAQFAAYGLAAEATESREGAALQIGRITLSGRLPEGAGSFFLSMTGPRFDPAEGGAVNVAFDQPLLFEFGGALKGEGSAGGTVEARCEGMTTLMSGTQDKALSEGSVDSCVYTLTALSLNGAPVDLSNSSANLRLRNSRNRVTTEIGETHLTMTIEVEQDGYDIDYRVMLPDPDGDAARAAVIDGGGHGEKAAFKMASMLPRDGIDPLGLHDQLRAGLSIVLDSTVAGGGSFQKTTVAGEVVEEQTVEQGPSDAHLSLDAVGFEEAIKLGAFTVRGKTQPLPFPYALSAEGAEARIRIPLLMGEGQDANFRLGLSGVVLGDDLWALFDPGAELPRDAASLVLDLGARLSVLFDFLDIRALIGGAKPTAMPVMAKTATLNELRLKAGGAELTGQGDLAFDYTDMTTFAGMPAPKGKVSLRLSGAQALIDRLVAAGLLPEDNATGARMMLAMFSRAAGEDAVTSEIEIRRTGEVLVNGQRVR